jgi:hypothetical protein
LHRQASRLHPCCLNQFQKTKNRDRASNQYHNPLAVEPESAKDAARKITAADFLQTPPRSNRPRQPNNKDFFK